MIRFALGSLLALTLHSPVAAQSSPVSPALDHTESFERAFATSAYTYDACGDALAGRNFRRALFERFAQCPFTPAARSRFQQNTDGQLEKSRKMVANMVEIHGGLPMRLEGMSMTCHEQQASDSYRQFRDRLEQYSQGVLTAEAIIPAPCDAPDIVP